MENRSCQRVHDLKSEDGNEYSQSIDKTKQKIKMFHFVYFLSIDCAWEHSNGTACKKYGPNVNVISLRVVIQWLFVWRGFYFEILYLEYKSDIFVKVYEKNQAISKSQHNLSLRIQQIYNVNGEVFTIKWHAFYFSIF